MLNKLSLLIMSEVLIFVGEYNCIMLKRECPADEIYKSCAFHQEYTCWTQADKEHRVRTAPKRLLHCRAGCYCRRGLVREYPGGACSVAARCRNKKLQAVLQKLPKEHMFEGE